MNVFALVLSALAYGLFYAAAPGRQATPLAKPRILQGGAILLTLAALIFGVLAYGPAIGPLLVLTAMMAAASVLVMVGPLLQAGVK